MSKRIRPRNIALITSELDAALKREATNVITIGSLLIEAHEQLDYGEWLAWLEQHFGPTDRTAENYMNAARFAARFEMVANLKLRPTVLYLLGKELDNPTGFYNRKAIKAILKAAESDWVNVERAHEIAASLQPKPKPLETPDEVRAEMAAAAMEAEIDDILAGAPPELPPASEAISRDVILPPFDQALATLARLQTKPLASFVPTTHELDRIRAVIVFLQEVADAIEKRRAAD
ncbi:DUF3102 domain-containing protein [Bradyrhizobium diazoefficiens]|nr:DUF3102 domain-containing protein [Bradyrhizobium diazoefficiens]MBR0778742.1 DUF3102 domain-containing protein [Bradyrhizobium diazoefficiens]